MTRRILQLGFILLMVFGLISCGSGGGGGGGNSSDGDTSSGSGGSSSELTKTVILTDSDGNVYEVTADKDIADNITLTNDGDASLQNIYSPNQTPLLSNFQKLNIPTTQETTSVEIKVTYNTPPDRIFVHNKLTGDTEYKPFYNANDGSTSAIFYTSDNISFMPVQEGTTNNAMLSKAVAQVTYDKSLDIVSNDGNILELQMGTNLDATMYTLCHVTESATCVYGSIDQATNTIEIDVTTQITTSGVYILELRRATHPYVVWQQEMLIQKPSDLSDNGLTPPDIKILAERFAPILAYNDKESFYPSSLEYIFNEVEPSPELGSKSAQMHDTKGGVNLLYSDARKYMPYNGHSGSLLEPNGDLSTALEGRTGSVNDATVYYSFLKDPGNNRFYLNYHMLYSFDPKSTITSNIIASHAFDRESITLVFDGPIDISTSIPLSAVYGAHIPNQPIALLKSVDQFDLSYTSGRVAVAWEDVYKYPVSDMGNPIVAIAEGSHALYPVCGYYEVFDMNTGHIYTGRSLKENACGGKGFEHTENSTRLRTPNDYTLKSLNLEHITSAGTYGYLAYSGEWIDGLWKNNAKFPPFTDRERDTQTWVAEASIWYQDGIPQYSKDLMAELITYLDSNPPVSPTVPTGLTVTAASSTQIDLSWNASSDNVGVLGYDIYRGGTEIATTTTTSYSDTGLNPSTQYCYTVLAYDGAGNESGQSSSVCATTQAVGAAPIAPAGFAASSGDSLITLSWNSVSGATSYNIYWSTLSGVTKTTGTKIVGATSPYAQTGLANGTTYYYVVTAENSYGESVESSEVSATPTSQATWAKTYGGANTDLANSIQQTSDGGYIVAGQTLSAGSVDAWVLKINADGTVAWQKTYGDIGGIQSTNSIQQTSDGGYIVAGYTISLGAGSIDAWVLKLNADGTVAWQKTYGDGGGALADRANSIQQTSDGGYIVAGRTNSFGAGSTDAWVLKLNADGTVAWQKTYGGIGIDRAYSIQQTSDGGYIVAGSTSSFGAGSADAWVLKLNADGIVAWQKAYGGTSLDYTNSIQQTSDGGYIVAGSTSSFGAGGADAWVLKLNADGIVAWQKTYGGIGIGVDYTNFIQQTSDGGYIVARYTNSFGAGGSDAWVSKLNADGTVAWQKTYGGGGDDYAYSIQQTSDGGYIAAGQTLSFGAGDNDLWVLKLDSNGDIGGACALIGITSVTPVDTSITGVDTSVTPADTAVSAVTSSLIESNSSLIESTQCIGP